MLQWPIKWNLTDIILTNLKPIMHWRFLLEPINWSTDESSVRERSHWSGAQQEGDYLWRVLIFLYHRHRKLRPPAYQRDSLLPALLQAPHQRISLSTQVIYACSLYACKEFYSICQERNIFTRSIVNGVDKYCGLLWTWINRVDGRWMQYISHDYNLTYLSAFQDKVL